MVEQSGSWIPRDQDDQGNAILAVDATFFTISTIAVVVRVVTRLGITQNFGLDDLTIVLAQLLAIAGKVFIIEEVANGLGQHMTVLTAETYATFLKFNYLDWAQTILVLAVSKISICLFLQRLPQYSRLKNAIYGMTALILLTHIPTLFAYLFQCHPISGNWSVDRTGCVSQDAEDAIVIVQGTFSILIDLILTACPVVLFRNSDLKTSAKVALSVLMGLGTITTIVCIVRTALSRQIKAADLSWNETPNALLRIVEVNLGITLACAPTMKSFIKFVQARVTGKYPRGMLPGRRTSSSIEHVRWHSGFRISPPAPTRRQEPRKPRKLPAAAYKISYHAAQRFDPPSIILPIQRWEPDLRSFYDDGHSRWNQTSPSGSRNPRPEDSWTLDGSLEHHMKAAIEHNTL